MKSFISALCLTAMLLSTSFATGILVPADPVVGGQIVGTDFIVGAEGCCDAEVNQWPGGEPPAMTIDGVGQKYLNFGRENTGILINPGSDDIVDGIQLWTANDAIERDPATYQVYGTNATSAGAVGGALLVPGSSLPVSAFTLIADGDLALPDSRNDGGTALLDDANSQTIAFANDTAYDTYMVIFPTVKDPLAANSMQIAEIQLKTGTVPEPSALGLMGLAFCGLLGLRRRR